MSLKILVVEDDSHTRTALAELLEQDGNVCATAANGNEALRQFETHAPDLVCLDVMMPHKSGYELCREFRRQSPDIPIIFITAKAEEIDKVVGLEMGADDYIVKPFGCREVLARVHAVARRCFGEKLTELEEPQEFKLGHWTVFPKRLRAVSSDVTIELSKRELQLLVLLIENQGEVVTREEIFRVGWGYDRIPNSRTLDQMVSQLRARIESDPKNPTLIQTVYGVGYRYDED